MGIIIGDDEAKQLINPVIDYLKSGDLQVHTKHGHGDDSESFVISYPNDGTRATLGTGTSIIDFRSGTIKSPSSVVTGLSNSLSNQGLEFMRSVVINADQAIVIQLDSEDKTPVRAGAWVVQQDVLFEKLSITTTMSTSVFVSASTANRPVINISGGATTTNSPESLSDGRKVVAAAGTAEVLASDTPCKSVIVCAETNNGGVVVVGGSTVVAALATRQGIPLYPGDTWTRSINNLSKVYVDALVNGDGVTYDYTN